MAVRKRNEWLETENSDDEEKDQGYNSEEQEESRGARSIKRRRVDQDSDDSVSQDSEDEEDEVALDKSSVAVPKPVLKEHGRFALAPGDSDDGIPFTNPNDEEDDDDQEEREDEEEEDEETSTKPKPVQPLTTKQLLKSQKATKRTGVIYISRIPPFMKPATLKHYLSPYGPINRVFLTPEDPVVSRQRIRNGGNKKKSFTDGWVEFVSKKHAKDVAASLNGNIIGGKKGSFYHDDMWNIKYLTGFKWSHLTEQIANENAEREARLRTEIARTRRENRGFVEDVERAKMLEGMRVKKAAKREREGGAVVVGEKDEVMDSRGHRMSFRQNEVKSKRARDLPKVEQTDETKRVLSKIF